ncbi:MAG: rhodanese-like domain-containing protein, partial [Thermodesulfobacteriota bacterium]
MLKNDVANINWDQLPATDPDTEALLDLRTEDEINTSGTIDGAVHIPLDSLRERINELDPQKTYLPYCAIGLRGYLAYRILKQKGYKARNLSGGMRTYLGATENIIL